MPRYGIEAFPTLKILSADGFVLGEPEGRDTDDLVKAIDAAKTADAEFAAALAKADMTKPETRSAWVVKHLGRADAASALKLYEGFDKADASPARFTASVAVAKHYVMSRKNDEATKILDGAEPAAKSPEQKKELTDLRVMMIASQINKAFQAKDKALCFKLLDEIVAKYPEHDLAKRAPKIKENIAKQLDKKKSGGDDKDD